MSLVITDGNGVRQNLPAYDPAYAYGGVTFTPVAAPTTWVIVAGAANKFIRIKRVRISGLATTAGSLIVQLLKNSDLGTLGSAVLTGVTGTPLDSRSAAAAATVSTVGTANYTTVPALVGSVIRTGRVYLEIVTVGRSQEMSWDFSTRMDQAPILTTALEAFTLNSAGGTLPAGTKLDWEIQIEESSVA